MLKKSKENLSLITKAIQQAKKLLALVIRAMVLI